MKAIKTIAFPWIGLLYICAGIAHGQAQAALLLSVEKDCQTIQSAIDALPERGGEVHLESGLYLCHKPILLERNNIRLEGEGPSTLLRLADNANSPVIIMGSKENLPSHTVKHVEIAKLMIDGNRVNQQSECMGGNCSAEFPLRNNGVSIRRCNLCKVESVTVYAAKSGGLVTELGSRNLSITDYTSYDNQFDGLAGYETEDSTFSGINLYNNLAAGISTDIHFNNNKFFNVTISGNRSVGIFMRDSVDNSFTNLHIRNNAQHGIFIAQVDADPSKAAMGNTFSSLVISGSGGLGLLVNDSSCINNMILGAQFVDNKGGCFSEANSGLTESLGVICR